MRDQFGRLRFIDAQILDTESGRYLPPREYGTGGTGYQAAKGAKMTSIYEPMASRAGQPKPVLDFDPIEPSRATRPPSAMLGTATRGLYWGGTVIGLLPFALDLATGRDPWEGIYQQYRQVMWRTDPSRLIEECRCG